MRTASPARSRASPTKSSNTTAAWPISRWSACAAAACRSRGALPHALHEITGDEVPTGALDITLYRDDLMRHRSGRSRWCADRDPVLHRRPHDHAGRRRALYRPDDAGGARRADRLRPAEGDSAGRPGRSRPPRAADQGRLRRQERADVAARERAGAPARDRRRRRSRHRRARSEHGRRRPVAPPPLTALRRKDLLGIADLSAEEIVARCSTPPTR